MDENQAYGQGPYGNETPYGMGAEGAGEAVGPVVIPLFPPINAEKISPYTFISVSIVTEKPLDMASLYIEVDPGDGIYQDAYRGDETPSFKPGWNGRKSDIIVNDNLYVLVIDPISPFFSNAQVNIRVTAFDTDGNELRIA